MADLQLRVTPGASTDRVGPFDDDVLHVRVTRPAAEGAANRAVLRLVGKAIGVAGGLFAAKAAAKTLASQLHGVAPFDVATLVGACAVMAAIGLLAILWPARRAAQQDPMRALNGN